MGTATVHHWPQLQANVALSSREAELNSAVKGICEAIGLRELLLEVLEVSVHVRIHVDASAVPSRCWESKTNDDQAVVGSGSCPGLRH